jgi:hypothetical protein
MIVCTNAYKKSLIKFSMDSRKPRSKSPFLLYFSGCINPSTKFSIYKKTNQLGPKLTLMSLNLLAQPCGPRRASAGPRPLRLLPGLAVTPPLGLPRPARSCLAALLTPAKAVWPAGPRAPGYKDACLARPPPHRLPGQLGCCAPNSC